LLSRLRKCFITFLSFLFFYFYLSTSSFSLSLSLSLSPSLFFFPLGLAPTLLINIRLGWKCLSRANTLAYYEKSKITDKKIYYIGPWSYTPACTLQGLQTIIQARKYWTKVKEPLSDKYIS
jgi:hypothetical protein